MGLLNFWKKKQLDTSSVQSLNLPDINADLPSIRGENLPDINADLPSLDGANLPDIVPEGNPEKNANAFLPPAPNLPGMPGDDASKSMSVNLPSLDFSMPAPDDVAEPMAMPPQPVQLVQQAPQSTQRPALQGDALAPEGLNELFISDGWTEPDFTNYDSYIEPSIEEPKAEDFKGADLPKFEDQSNLAANAAQQGTLLAPTAPYPDKSRIVNKPVELFIKGNAYNRVFIELDQMSYGLSRIESQLANCEDILKREEPFLNSAKEQMEYLYRRLNQVDKKIFAQ